MKKKQHVLPCGRVIYYREYTPKDIGESMRTVILSHKKKLSTLFSSTHIPNRLWVPRLYSKFTSVLIGHLLECLMNGDRVGTLKDHQWMIAGRQIPNNKHLNWHTNGLSYGIHIKNLKGNFGVRMSRKARKALRQKIDSGFKYHVTQ